MQIRTVYQCDYCKKIRMTEKGIKRHEKECHRNPKAKNCFSCVHASMEWGADNGCGYYDEPLHKIKDRYAKGRKSFAPLCKKFKRREELKQ